MGEKSALVCLCYGPLTLEVKILIFTYGIVVEENVSI
jgi:hypothetical protein